LKCPNCGKEALLVNGKYVCVDCGIEISPQEQALQSQNKDIEAAINQTPITNQEVTPSTPQPQPNTPDVESQSSPKAQGENFEADVSKPVESYYKDALNENQAPQEASKSTNTGVYDFSESQGSNDVSDKTVKQDESEAEEAKQAKDFFAPESFNLKEEAQTVAPEEDNKFEAYSTPSGIGVGEPPISDLEGGIPVSQKPTPIEAETASQQATDETLIVQSESQVPPESTPINITETQNPPISNPEVNQNQKNFKNLDQMLNETVSPASAYGPSNVDSVRHSTTNNVNNNQTKEKEDLPPVEEVFGDSSDKTPTAQDFGVSPKPEPKKSNKKPYIYISIAFGALLLLGGALVGVLAFLNSTNSDNTNNARQLEPGEVTTVSAAVSMAMDESMSITANFNLSADLQNLTTKEDSSIDNESLGKINQKSGVWQVDTDNDVYLSSSAEQLDKKIYIESDDMTYVYSEDKSEWQEKEGFEITSIPAMFSPQNRGAVFYVNNIERVISLGSETVDGVTYNKYEINPTADIVKDLLGTVSSLFGNVEYDSFDASQLKINVWLGPDNRLYKVLVNGDVTISSQDVDGSISLSGVVEYNYENVVIESPKLSAGGESEEELQKTSESGKEEGETSSNILETKTEVIDARG